MPVCFMIMPYGRKPTQAEPGRGPAEIDFNALWDRGYVPIIKALGYEPVRADQDTGALIIGQMLERLYFADLVLADMTIPNGNVYYEVGIRHAAQKTGCVLLAADWSKQLFDVVQMRTVRYPLPEGNITEATAAALQAADQGRTSLRSATGFRRCTSRSRAIRQCRSSQGDDDAGPAGGARRISDQGARGARRAAGERMRRAQELIATEGTSARDLPDRPRIVDAAARQRQ